jgi:hypothetical protein
MLWVALGASEIVRATRNESVTLLLFTVPRN